MAIDKNIKIALVHDWLSKDYKGGAEKVLKEIGEALSKKNLNYDLYTLVNHLDKENFNKLNQQQIFTSIIQNLPFSKKHFHKYLPLFPFAIEQFDLDEYNLVLSSSHSVAKGVITSPDQLHISYIHSPMRYAWDQMHIYLNQSSYKKLRLTLFLRLILQNLRKWDYISSVRVDKFIANSSFTAKRIKKYWGRESEIIHPPVNTNYFLPNDNREDFYLSVSRLVPNKRVDLLVKAFNKIDLPLIIIGEGPEKKDLQKIANKNIKFLGFKKDVEIKKLMENCRAFLYAGIEDFGIAPVEAMAAGAPIIAYGKAGILDTVNCITSNHKIPTGIIYKDQSPDALKECVKYFEDKKIWKKFSNFEINSWSQNFGVERFHQKFTSFINQSFAEFNN
mgnify:FL=1